MNRTAIVKRGSGYIKAGYTVTYDPKKVNANNEVKVYYKDDNGKIETMMSLDNLTLVDEEWFVDFPTQPGLYWFYGREDEFANVANDLFYVRVDWDRNRNQLIGYCYEFDVFFRKNEAIGWWKEVDIPKVSDAYFVSMGLAQR